MTPHDIRPGDAVRYMYVTAGNFAAWQTDSHGHRPQKHLDLRKIVKLVAQHASLTGQTGAVLAIFAVAAVQAYVWAAACRDVLLLRVRAENHRVPVPRRSSCVPISALVAANT